MTLKTGEVPKESNSEKESKTLEHEQSRIIAEMRLELEALKKNQMFSPAAVGGISAEQLKEILQVVTQKKEEELDLSQGVVAEKIPKEDFNPEGVRFYAPLAGYVISGDKRNGHSVKLPWGKKSIFFEHLHTRKIQSGKYQEVSPLSMYISHSKKEIEWLREHSYCGIIFYEGSQEIKNREALKSARLADIMVYLKNLELPQLTKKCHESGVGISDDVAVMRTNLAFKLFTDEKDKEELFTKSSLEEADKASVLLKRK